MARKLSYQERRFRVTRLFVGFVSFFVNHLAFSFVAPTFKRRWRREGMDPTSDEFRNRWSDLTDRWVFANLVAALACSVAMCLARNIATGLAHPPTVRWAASRSSQCSSRSFLLTLSTRTAWCGPITRSRASSASSCTCCSTTSR